MNFFSRFFVKSVFEDADGIHYPVKTAYLSAIAATNNQLLVTAVTARTIRVLSGNITSLGAASNLGFLSASGGTALAYYTIPANTVADPNVPIRPNQFGEIETISGQGLYVNCGAVACNLHVRYIEALT